MRRMARFSRLIRRFLLARRGVAAVEFALILPIMLLVYIGTVEASALISMDRRVQTVAGSVGDLVARQQKSVTSAELLDYFRASETIMALNDRSALVQTVSVIRVPANANNPPTVLWSRKHQGYANSIQTGHAPNSTYDLPAEIATLARGGYVVVSEAAYLYTPLLGIVFKDPLNLYRENFYMPRAGGSITCC